MDNKHVTVSTYDAHCLGFDVEFERHMRRYNMAHVGRFLASLRPGAAILDLGSGPGNYALEFVKQGFTTVCGDLSSKMVELCRSKGLCAELLDLETFELDLQFDGIWANACLLHLSKAKIPSVLERIARHLEGSGVFACAVKEGQGEGLVADSDYQGARRYFSHFNDEEFRSFLEPLFEVHAFERTPSRSGGTVFIKYLSRLRRP